MLFLFVFFFASNQAKAGTATFFGVVVVMVAAGLTFVHNIGVVDCQEHAEWEQFNAYRYHAGQDITFVVGEARTGHRPTTGGVGGISYGSFTEAEGQRCVVDSFDMYVVIVVQKLSLRYFNCVMRVRSSCPVPQMAKQRRTQSILPEF